MPALFGRLGGVVGGAERYAFELARHMAEEVPTKLVTFGDATSRQRAGRLEIEVIGNPWYVRGNRFNPLSARLIAALRDADVIHCHQRAILMSSLAALGGRLTGKRVVATDLGGGAWDFSAYIRTDGWFHRHLHISDFSRRVNGHQANPRAAVISGGVDTTRFSQRPTPVADGPVLFVGRLMPHKGVHDLIRALPAELTLEIIGQPYDDDYFGVLRTLATGKAVSFRTECNDDELIDAYHRALCVVLPSVHQSEYGKWTAVPELLGQTLLEGMACGVPCIATDVASLPEVVEHGVTGWIVPANTPPALGERLRWLRDHPSDAARMGEAARRRVEERFTWPTVVDRCLREYGVR